MSRDFCVRWRKISKQIQYKDVRRSLYGVAFRFIDRNKNKAFIIHDLNIRSLTEVYIL